MIEESLRNALGQPIGRSLEHWQPCAVPDRTPMQGQFSSLVATDVEHHGSALYQAFAKDKQQGNWTYLPYGPFETESAFLDWLTKVSAGQDPLFHTVLDGAGLPVGLCSFLRIDAQNGGIEVGHIHFSPLMQRTPVATEAMYLMMRRAFDQLGYRRYEWKCDALNGPSRAAAERLGFSFEGIFRQASIYKGRNRDTAWFSITDHEWPVIKQSFERWLSVENFDGQGLQIRSLKDCKAVV